MRGRVIPGERLSTAHFAKAVQTELRIRPASTFLMSLSTTLQTTPRLSSPTLPPPPSLPYTSLSSPHAINSKLTTFCCCLIQQDFDVALETGINFSRYLIRDFEKLCVILVRNWFYRYDGVLIPLYKRKVIPVPTPYQWKVVTMIF